MKDANRTLQFLADVLGAVEVRRYPDADGRVRHAETRIGESVIMLADSTPEWPPLPSYVHIYVPDVDDVYGRALAAGARSVQEPVQKGDEDKRGGVEDPGGTTWWIATRVG